MSRARRRATHRAVQKAARIQQRVDKSVGVGGSAAVGIARASMYDTVAAANRNNGGDLALYYMLWQRHPHVRTCASLIGEAVGSEGFAIVPVTGLRRKPVGKAAAPDAPLVLTMSSRIRKAALVSFETGFIGDDDGYAAVVNGRLVSPIALRAAERFIDEVARKADAVAKAAVSPAGGAAAGPTTPTAVPKREKVVFDIPDEDADPRMGMLKDYFRGAFAGTTMSAVLLATAVDLCISAISWWRIKRIPVLVDGVVKQSPRFLERLDPRLVEPKLNDARTAITGIRLKKTTDGGGIDPLGAEDIDAKDVIMFTRPGGDPLFGEPSLLEALDLTIAADLGQRTERESSLRNGVHPSFIAINKDSNEEEMEAALLEIKRTKAGAQNAGEPIIFPGEGWDIVQMTGSGKHDSDFLKGGEVNRDEVFGVYKVPPGMIFSQKGALGQAGKTADEIAFQKYAVLPFERAIYSTLTTRLLDVEFGIRDLHLTPKRLNALRLDMIQVAKDMVQAGATGNEARDMMGLPIVIDGPIDMDIPLFLGQKQPIAAEVAPPGETTDKPTDGAD